MEPHQPTPEQEMVDGEIDEVQEPSDASDEAMEDFATLLSLPPPDLPPPPPPSPALNSWLAQVAEQRSRNYVPPQLNDDESFLLNNFHLTELVFAYLRPIDLCRLSVVCKAFKDETESNELWQGLYAIVHKRPAVVPVAYLSSWKECYRRAKPFADVAAWQVEAERKRSKDALLLPHGTYPPLLIKENSFDELTIVGVTGPQGEPVVIEAGATTCTNSAELLVSNALIRNISFRSQVEEVPPTHWCPSVLYTRGTNIVLERCEVTARCARVYGISAEPGASLELRNCHLHSMPHTCLIMWKDASMTIRDTKITDCGPIVLRASATMRMYDSHVAGKAKYEAELIAALTDTVLEFENCKLIGGGDRSCGVSTYGDLTMRNTELSGAFFSITKRDKGTVRLTDTRIISPREGGNSMQVCDPCDVIVTNCEMRGATSAIEMEHNEKAESRTTLQVNECKFVNNECAILLARMCDTMIRNCTFENNGTGVRLEEPNAAQLKTNSFNGSTQSAVHLQVSGALEPNVEQQLRQENSFRRNRADIVVDDVTAPVPEDVGGADRSSLDRTILIALSRNVCTFQLTGPHYKKQRVYRCLTCKLTDYRGMCTVCSTECHAGHEVVAEDVQMFYCDCGAEKFCETLQKARSRNTGEKRPGS